MLTFCIVPLRLRSISSTLWATSCVCLCRSTSTDGSMGGISAGRCKEPRPRTTGPEQSAEIATHRLQITDIWHNTSKTILDTLRYSQSVSRLGRELILIFCSRFLVMKCVRSPSWLMVPSHSRPLDMVALRPSTCPPLAPPPRTPPPQAPLISSRLLLSCMPRTTRSRSGTDRTRTSAITWAGHGESSRSGSRGGVAWSGGGAGTRGGASSGEMEVFSWTSSEESGLVHSSGLERVGGCSVESVPAGCNLCRSVY